MTEVDRPTSYLPHPLTPLKLPRVERGLVVAPSATVDALGSLRIGALVADVLHSIHFHVVGARTG